MPYITVTIRVEVSEVPQKGWVARTPELRATAQGDTEAEAVTNLRSLLETYPEVLDALIDKARQHPKLELVTA